MIPGLTAIGVFLVGVILALYFQWRLPKGEDSGLAVLIEDRTEDDLDAVLAERSIVRTNQGFGRRNPHCSRCGDERGGSFGHETSECRYRSGMTAGEVAELLPEHLRNEFWDQQIDRYFAGQDGAA